MGEIRKLNDDREFEVFVDILSNAYPGLGIVPVDKRGALVESMRKRHHEFAEYNLYGYFRDGEMLGGMALYDYEMNWFNQTILPSGGVGMVAVDLLHKKERVAYELLQFYLKHYRDQGASMALLYPFRPDFYKKMGFGIGTKMNRYEFHPSSLQKGPSKEHVIYLNETHREQMRACYDRFARTRHGLMLRTDDEVSRLFPAGSQMVRLGVQEGGELRGYLIYYYERVEESNFGLNNVVVRELVYETPEALSELLTFLHSQSDQFHRVILYTQDEDFHHYLHDPRNGSHRILPSVYHESNAQGVGIMYRVLNLQATLKNLQGHNFGGQTCRFQLIVDDAFLQEQTALHLHLENGQLTSVQNVETEREADREVEQSSRTSGTNEEPRVEPHADLCPTLRLSIENFSSLLMGSVTLKSLHRNGQAQLSDAELLGVLHRAFLPEEKPLCMTAF